MTTEMTRQRKTDTDAYVGGRIRMRRKILGLSQERLANALGITFQQVQKYEDGSNRVAASRLQAMSIALEVPVTYFFPDDARAPGGTREEVDMMDFMSTSEGLALSRAFARIRSARVRRKVVQLARALAEECGR